MKSTSLLFIFHLIAPLYGSFDIGFGDDLDLTAFHSRPDIKSPILDVTVHDEAALSSGYFFVAPYTDIMQPAYPPKTYQACQSGPAIYDRNGVKSYQKILDLVWSGACTGRNQNACDFRSTLINGTNYLSAIMFQSPDDVRGHGLILDNTYRPVARIEPPFVDYGINMHEFLLVPSPQRTTAIHIIHRTFLDDYRAFDSPEDRGWTADTGFRELDISTNETVFEWWPSDHIPRSESTMSMDEQTQIRTGGWNWFHSNSIDKNDAGDYLVNSRYTNAMYKVSGSNRSVLWQLGGKHSSFVLDGFNFSRQHDARWISFNKTTEVISFLDNAADGISRTANTSSALIVALDITANPPTARVLSRIWRPDGKLSRLRGNYQTFSTSSNTFVGWSGNGYMTEHAEDGRLLAEANFRGSRFVTYRSYKFNFTGLPMDEPPILKASVYGPSRATSVTVAYVSWNGATEVNTWRFYAIEADADEAGQVLLGERQKTGFETTLEIQGYYGSIYAEAVDKDGVVLSRSDSAVVTQPRGWEEVDAVESDELPVKSKDEL